MAFFTFSWLCVAASSFAAATYATRTLYVENYCAVVIVNGRLIPAPFIVAVINHTLIVIAITCGVCRNTLDGNLTFRHGIKLMLGKSLPTFSKTLLHDSQISYLYVLLPSSKALETIS